MYVLEKTINQIKQNIIITIKNLIETNQINNNNYDLDNLNFDVEIPGDNIHGELSSNIALVCAKKFRVSPRILADLIKNNINTDNLYVKNIEVAGPGFINFYLSPDFFAENLKEIYENNNNYGKCNYGQNKKVMIEFVSANPTGPMHIGNARLGALGDCLADIMKTTGFNVYKEFYVNDAGNQILKFGKSLRIRYLQICDKNKENKNNIIMPEDCYQGSDITELAQEFFDIHKFEFLDTPDQDLDNKLIEFALPKNINKIKEDLEKYKIFYDNWFYESELYSTNQVNNIINILKEKNLTYLKDNCLWFKTSDFGSEKDEVLVRSNTIPTYFAADIAYHYNKFTARNFDICINIWGADHHGHVERMKNSMQSLGINRNNLHVILVQLVKLIKNGEIVRMSKRTGKSVQLSDLLEEVGTDSARFIFNSQEPSSGMDFDLDLAVMQDSKNPVYYVQYAHARICNIFKNNNIIPDNSCDLSNLIHESERNLIYFMSQYPMELIACSRLYDPTKITKYVINLANLFHKFYSSCKVNIPDNINLSKSRLYLCQCVRIIIKNILDIMKVNAPEFMN